MAYEEVLTRIETTNKPLLTIRNSQMKFLEHIMRKEDLEKLILTGHGEGKRETANNHFDENK